MPDLITIGVFILIIIFIYLLFNYLLTDNDSEKDSINKVVDKFYNTKLIERYGKDYEVKNENVIIYNYKYLNNFDESANDAGEYRNTENDTIENSDFTLSLKNNELSGYPVSQENNSIPIIIVFIFSHFFRTINIII